MAELWSAVASNILIQGFALLIVLITLLAIILVFRRGPGHPWVSTITEMLPVLGLMGTFLGAFFVFASKSGERLEGIVVAFFVSFLGWACYVILHAIATWRTKIVSEPEPVSHSAMQLHEMTDRVFGNLSGINEELAKIEHYMHRIDALVNSEGLMSMAEGANIWNHQLERLSGNMARYNELMSGLKRLADLDIEIGIKDNVDLEGITAKIRRMNDALVALTATEKKFQFKVDLLSNQDQVDEAIARIASALKTLEAMTKQFNIEIQIPETTRRAAAELENFGQVLSSLNDLNRPQHIDISIPNDVSAQADSLAELTAALTALNSANRNIKVELEMPLNNQRTAMEIGQLTEVLKHLESVPKSYDFKIGVADGLNDKAASILDLTRSLRELAKSTGDYRINLDLPDQLDQAASGLNQLVESLHDLEHTAKEHAIKVAVTENLGDQIPELQKAESLLQKIVDNLKDINNIPKQHQVSLDLPPNLGETLSQLNELKDLFETMPRRQREVSYKVALDGQIDQMVHQLKQIAEAFRPLSDFDENVLLRVGLEIPPDLNKTLDQIRQLPSIIDNFQAITESLEGKMSLDYYTRTTLSELRDLVEELMTLRVTREPERGKLSSMVRRLKKPFGSSD